MEAIHLPVAHKPEGTLVEIRAGMAATLQTLRGVSLREYHTLIEDLGPDSVTVLAPMEGRRYQPLAVGQPVAVHFREDGKGYLFDAAVLRTYQNPQPVVELAAPRTVYPYERREYYRLMTRLTPRSAIYLDAQGGEVRPVPAVVLDISGGGLQFASPNPLPPGAQVRFELPLDEAEPPLTALARVLNVREPEEGRELYRFNARFEDLTARERERIVRYVFQQQIELRKRGLL